MDALRGDASLLERFDVDRSGELDPHEWALIQRVVEVEVAQGIARKGGTPGGESLPERLHNRFDAVGLLGVGGQGRTWLAVDSSTREHVAVKELWLGRITDWKAIELFERESDVLESLRHNAIPRYVDSFHVDDDKGLRFYMAQEFVDGPSLESELDAVRWDEEDAVVAMRELCGVLRYLHELSPPVIHRDLKPSNILRRRDGSLALIDFGAVATAIPGAAGGSTIVGTNGYMPLEQYMGRAVEATDVYALGATFVHLLSREHPADLPLVRSRVSFEDHVNVSEPFAKLLADMLAPNVEDRLTDARAVLARLNALPDRASVKAEERLAAKKAESEKKAAAAKYRPGQLTFASRLSQSLERSSNSASSDDSAGASSEYEARLGFAEDVPGRAPDSAHVPRYHHVRHRGDSGSLVAVGESAFSGIKIPKKFATMFALVVCVQTCGYVTPHCGGHREALIAANECPAVTEVLGDNVHQAFPGMGCGNMESTGCGPGRTGTASMTMPVRGDERAGRLSWAASDSGAGGWVISSSQLRGNGQVSVVPCEPARQSGSLQCVDEICTAPGPLPHNLEDSLRWDPCDGLPFAFNGLIDLETCCDDLFVGSSRFTGTRSISGNAPGPVPLRLSTDGSIASGGLTELTATCGLESTAWHLSCDGLVCSTPPDSRLPDLVDEWLSWDPCNGGSFTFAANVDLEDGSDILFVGAQEITGEPGFARGVGVGPTIVRLHTDYSVPSGGVQSLEATCGDASDGVHLRCSGARCRTRGVLGHDLSDSAVWDPCNGGAFAYRGRADFEPCCDAGSIGSEAFNAYGERVSGTASGPVVVTVRTDGSVDSEGFNLRSTCE